MTDPVHPPVKATRVLRDRITSHRLLLAIALAIAILAAAAVIWRAQDRENETGSAAARGSRTVASGGPAGSMDGMDMSGDGSVRITGEQLKQFGITFGYADQRMLLGSLQATGTVVPAETGLVLVTSKFSGFVERLHANFVGMPVRRGQPLIELYSAELIAAQEELLLVQRASRGGSPAVPGIPGSSTDMLAASVRRLRLLDVPQSHIDEVIRTGRVRRTVTLTAPASGVITDKRVIQGQAIGAGEPLLTVSDLSRVWVEVEVRESDAGSLRPGLGADVALTAFPGQTFKGRIEFIQPVLDPTTRTIRARVGVSNTGMALKPGMYASVTFLIPSRTALTVPTSAVISTGERSIVFVDMMGGNLSPREVEIGGASDEFVEILAGLEAGQRVVTSAQFLLESESNIGDVMRGMIGQTGAGAMKMETPPPPPKKR